MNEYRTDPSGFALKIKLVIGVVKIFLTNCYGVKDFNNNFKYVRANFTRLVLRPQGPSLSFAYHFIIHFTLSKTSVIPIGKNYFKHNACKVIS